MSSRRLNGVLNDGTPAASLMCDDFSAYTAQATRKGKLPSNTTQVDLLFIKTFQTHRAAPKYIIYFNLIYYIQFPELIFQNIAVIIGLSHSPYRLFFHFFHVFYAVYVHRHPFEQSKLALFKGMKVL